MCKQLNRYKLTCNAWINGHNGANLHSYRYPLRPWVIKDQLLGATICCQNVPVTICHKDIITYKNSYIFRELIIYLWVTFTCFRNKYWKKISLCLCNFLVTVLWKLPLVHLDLPLVHAESLWTRHNFEMQIAPGSRQVISRLAYMYTAKGECGIVVLILTCDALGSGFKSQLGVKLDFSLSQKKCLKLLGNNKGRKKNAPARDWTWDLWFTRPVP